MSKLKDQLITIAASVVIAVGSGIAIDVAQAPSDNKVQQVYIESLLDNQKVMNESLKELQTIREEQIREQGRQQVLQANFNSLSSDVGRLDEGQNELRKGQQDLNRRVSTLEGASSS